MPDEDRHIADETLMRHADAPGALLDGQSMAHLDACTECRSKLEDYRLLGSAMADRETWEMVEEIETESRQLVLRAFVSRCAAEDAAAVRMLRDVLESQYRFAYARVAQRRRFRTGGVVRMLCDAAWTECPRDPRFARELAEAACMIAEALPDDEYPASAINELRGRAWKEYSSACRYLSEFKAGFDALARAERAYRRLPDGEPQLATVDLCRAILLWEQQRYDEALPLARAAARRFSNRRETRNYFEAKEVEALILHRQGDVAAACETYEQMFTYADELGDTEMKARSARNLGVAYRDRAEIGLASRYMLIALRLYEQLDQRAIVVLMRGLIARLALTAGNASEAVRRLPPLIDEMRRLGLRADASRAQLDLAEALLILGRLEEVEAVCSGLAAFFREAEMLTGALTAVAYLKETAAMRRLTTSHIEHVRAYIAQLERAPDLPFLRPSDQK